MNEEQTSASKQLQEYCRYKLAPVTKEEERLVRKFAGRTFSAIGKNDVMRLFVYLYDNALVYVDYGELESHE